MIASMHYEDYIKLLLSGKPNEANLYKSAFIPNRLYKYYSLSDDSALNEKKFETLSRGEVYLSKMDEFNDPFEGKALYFNSALLEEKGWNRLLIETVSDMLRNNYRIACFCNADEQEQNMPMWAYYANNHQGFCVEHTFSLNNMTFLYPVSYETKRILADKLMTTFINDMFDATQNHAPLSQEAQERMLLLYLTNIIKHKSWEHEREIRAVIPSPDGSRPYISAPPTNIYVGLNCSAEHCSRLIDVAKKFAPNCNIYKMTFDGNTSDSIQLQEISLL